MPDKNRINSTSEWLQILHSEDLNNDILSAIDYEIFHWSLRKRNNKNNIELRKQTLFFPLQI